MIQFTRYGLDALAAATAGKTKITFTALKTSSAATMSSGSYPDFTTIKQATSPTRIAFDKNTDTATVTGVFTNTGLGAAYQIKAIGLYATCAGEFAMSTARLFAYEVLDNTDPMPLPSEAPTSYAYAFNTTITNSSAVTIQIETGTYALASDMQDLSDHVDDVNATAQQGIVQRKNIRCNSTTASSDRAGFNYKQEVAWANMTADDYVDGVVSSGTHNGTWGVESAAGKVILWFVTQPATSVYVNVYREVTANV